MALSNTIVIDGIPILLERSARAKHLNISVKPFKGVRVAVPKQVPFNKAEEVAHAKITWIRQHLDRMRKVEAEIENNSLNKVLINRREVRKKLVTRLAELAEQHGFTYNRVFIRTQKTRWGSCSSKNNISLNMKLVLLPDELIDFVMLHELVHTRIKNHGKEFWRELDRVVGDSKGLDKKLKKYGLRLV